MTETRNAVGAPNWGEIPLIRQFRFKNPDDQLHLVLPGDVSCPDGYSLLGIVPSARVVCPSGSTAVKDAVFNLAEKDSDATNEILDAWAHAANRCPASSFFMIVDGCGLTYKSLTDGVLEGRFGRDSPGAVTFRFGVAFGGTAPLISDPVEGHLFARATGHAYDLISDDDCIHPWPYPPWPYTDCHSHWFTAVFTDGKRRWITKCFGGGCDPGESCTCGDPPNTGRTCLGLTTCWCQ